MLIESADAFPEEATHQSERRGLLRYAVEHRPDELAAAMAEEEQSIRDTDRAHWEPLRKMLSELRRQR